MTKTKQSSQNRRNSVSGLKYERFHHGEPANSRKMSEVLLAQLSFWEVYQRPHPADSFSLFWGIPFNMTRNVFLNPGNDSGTQSAFTNAQTVLIESGTTLMVRSSTIFLMLRDNASIDSNLFIAFTCTQGFIPTRANFNITGGKERIENAENCFGNVSSPSFSLLTRFSVRFRVWFLSIVYSCFWSRATMEVGQEEKLEDPRNTWPMIELWKVGFVWGRKQMTQIVITSHCGAAFGGSGKKWFQT